MNLHQIKIFVAISDKGSFSAAAEAIALTQSTVSQHMASLEDEVGVSLFDRQKRGVTLTSGGIIFLRHARRILSESDALFQAMNGFQGLEDAELVIGASNIPANYLVPPLLATLEQKHPGISLTMLTGDTAEVLKMLEGTEIELALVGSRTQRKEITFDPLVNDPLVLVVASSHPWAKQKKLSIDDLFGNPLIMRENGSGSGQSLDQAMRQAGRNPRDLHIAAHLGSNEAVLQAVASGYSGAFVSELSVRRWKQAEQLCRIDIDGLVVERKIWLATMKGRILSPAAEAFTQILKNHFQKDCGRKA
ncbi:MAG: LysR family transcriptional regulator [Desulfuromonas sp.]|nr:MAG: LysR family transcriptional regulator [Desulfuromonas sp.]